MQLVWLCSLFECLLSIAVVWVSIRLCITGGGSDLGSRGRSVSACLKLCLGCAGALGGTVGVPIIVLLNLRIQQCLYTCITLVCCPLLVRQFTMWLLILLTLNLHLQCRLGHRYTRVATRQRMLCLVLFFWICSVVTSFAQFIISSSLDSWGGQGAASIELEKPSYPNWTHPRTTPKLPRPQDRSVIGKYLPYGGFLSKFLVEDIHNLTYAELHGSHWALCAPDTVLRPDFQVYIYSVAVFILPLLILLAMYLDLMCVMPRQVNLGSSDPQKRNLGQARVLALSTSLLILLCLPLHTLQALRLYAPDTQRPLWVTSVASILFQCYSLVPPLLFIQPLENSVSGHASLAVTPLTSVSATSLELTSKGCTPLEFCPPQPAPEGKI